MRRLALLLVALASPAAASQGAAAQTPSDSTFVCGFPEVSPVLIGGIEALHASVVYPESERRLGTQGRVIVRFLITAEGVPTEVEVARSVSPGLDAAAVAAVRAARFLPGTLYGEPVPMRMTLPVQFAIVTD